MKDTSQFNLLPNSIFAITPKKNRNTEYIGDFGEMVVSPINQSKNGKLNLFNQTSFYSHRSGWDYVISNLMDLHNPNGFLFDGFLENTFCWRKSGSISSKTIPYKIPWIGVLHNPPNMPAWFSDNNSYPQSIINDPLFIDSIPHCKGLFVLSNYYKKFLKYYFPNIQIDVLYHPTEIPNVLFSYDAFIKNDKKLIINIGWWLRKLNSIFYLKCNKYKKIRLLPNNKCKHIISRLTEIERILYNIKLTSAQLNSVLYMDHLENNLYDIELSKNIVFLDLYDTSANNAIIECIARGTPVLVNRHPAIYEYLGEEYPFYFDSIEDASNKLNDFDLIKKTTEYLMTFSNRKLITIEYFKESFLNSKIYSSL